MAEAYEEKKPDGGQWYVVHTLTVHTLIPWLSCTEHVADHALIT